jgi:hypothetical protein
MGDVVAFPPATGAAIESRLRSLPVRARRAHFISAHHALQALCWQEALNEELKRAGLPADPVDLGVKHDLRKIVDLVGDELMRTPCACLDDLRWKRSMLAGLFDITWNPDWLEQLHVDEEAIGSSAA